MTKGVLADESPELNLAQLRPVLDETLDALRKTDRDAVLLRYAENEWKRGAHAGGARTCQVAGSAGTGRDRTHRSGMATLVSDPSCFRRECRH